MSYTQLTKICIAPTYNPYAIQGRQIVWQTTNYVTGIPDKNIMQPFNPKLKSATQRFTQF